MTDAECDEMLAELEPLLPMAVPVLRTYILELRAGMEAMRHVERIRAQQQVTQGVWRYPVPDRADG